MSAFYDIWISDSKPLRRRPGNEEWACKDSYWFSAPPGKQWKQELETDAYSLTVVGQFYEKVNLISLLKNCTRYATGISNEYEDPAGHYIIFIIDKVSGSKFVFTNRFGTYHAYWSSDKNVKGISTYYIGLAQQVTDISPDWEGITGFLAMGFFPEDKTYLKTIKIFNPASCYIFDNECQLKAVKKYWNWTLDTTGGPAVDDALLQALQSSISYAINNANVAIPLSGGLDSRMLAGVFHQVPEAGYQSAWAYAYGYSSKSQEIRIGRKISTALGIPFQGKVVPNYLFDKKTAITHSVELFQYMDGTRQACMTDELRHDADVVIGGHWGDVWMDSTDIGQETGEAALTGFFEKKIIKKGSSFLLDKIAAQHISKPGDYLEDYFHRYIKRYSHLNSTGDMLKAYKTDQWSFRWTMASVRMYQDAVLPVLPFYDRRVANLLLSLPQEQLKNRRYQVQFIRKFFPRLASITWQEYDANLYRYQYVNNRNYIYRAVHKLNRMVKGEPVLRNREIFYLNDSGREKLLADLKTPALTGIILPGDIDALLNDFYQKPAAGNGYAVSMLHTLARFFKVLNDSE